MKIVKEIATGVVVSGALAAAALGLSSGVANAAPPGSGTQWSLDRPGHGHGHDDWDWRGPRWAPPPPPPPYYGYGPSACARGPYGYVQVCI